jgi:hypothetical protein
VIVLLKNPAPDLDAELAWWAEQPLDPWHPVGDNSKLAPAGWKPPATDELTAPVELSPAHYRGLVHAMLRGARTGVENREHMTYSEGANRNSGVVLDRRSILGQFPPDADCSSYSGIWVPWDGSRFLKLADIWNGANFLAGFTGTQAARGMAIEIGDTVPCDQVFYGGTPWLPQHTTLTVGGGRCVSMGHQGDPGIYPIDLYGELPIVAIRRYIVKK